MDERKRILKLVENGTITAEEGIELLEALSKQKSQSQISTAPGIDLNSTKTEEYTFGNQNEDPYQNKEQNENSRQTTGFEDLFGKSLNNKKLDEFMGSLKQDISEFSGRMMGLMNTTLSKLNLNDIETPFGEKVEFHKSYAFPADEVRGLEIGIPNVRVSFEPSQDEQVTVNVHVKTPKKTDGTDTEARFLENFIELKDEKLEIQTELKMSQVELVIHLPEKKYDIILAKMFSGSCSLSNLDAKLVKVKTLNGSIKLEHSQFDHADLESMNGSIEARGIKGNDLEAETGNGRIYVDGDIKEVQAESVNGHVVVTTTSPKVYKLKASTVAGSVEMYIPKTVSIDGRASSNFGKIDVGLNDIVTRQEEEQFLTKTVHFSKMIESTPVLKLNGESRTGTVLIRYTTLDEI